MRKCGYFLLNWNTSKPFFCAKKHDVCVYGKVKYDFKEGTQCLKSRFIRLKKKTIKNQL